VAVTKLQGDGRIRGIKAGYPCRPIGEKELRPRRSGMIDKRHTQRERGLFGGHAEGEGGGVGLEPAIDAPADPKRCRNASHKTHPRRTPVPSGRSCAAWHFIIGDFAALMRPMVPRRGCADQVEPSSLPPPAARLLENTRPWRISAAGAHSGARLSEAARALVSHHNRNSPDAITTTEPTSSETVGTSPQIANPKMLAHTSDR
jgi:hypothetical protein